MLPEVFLALFSASLKFAFLYKAEKYCLKFPFFVKNKKCCLKIFFAKYAKTNAAAKRSGLLRVDDDDGGFLCGEVLRGCLNGGGIDAEQALAQFVFAGVADAAVFQFAD